MTRLILILLAIFIILTILRRFLRQYRVNSHPQNKPNQKSRLDKDKEKEKKNNGDAVDAKFEEIN